MMKSTYVPSTLALSLSLLSLFPVFCPLLSTAQAQASQEEPSAQLEASSGPEAAAEAEARTKAAREVVSQQDPRQPVSPDDDDGRPFRFLGANYAFDGAASAEYLYRFFHERIPTAEAVPRILDQKFILHVLHLEGALAVTNRPWSHGQFSVGYRFQQDWHATHTDMTAYGSDVFNPDAFPFATKLLESDHQVFGWYRHRLSPRLFINLYGAYRVRHEGAPQLSLQERRNKAENSPRLRSVKWLPSLHITTADYGMFLPYLYGLRQQNYGDDGLSFESYAADGRLSFGLRHRIALGSHTTLLSEVYRHAYTFKAFYHDYDRLGFVARADTALPFRGLSAGGILAYSVDSFIHPQVVVNSCRFPDGSASSSVTVACEREDESLYLSLFAKYRLTPEHMLTFGYANLASESNMGRHHDFSEYRYSVGYNYNFDRFYGSQSFSDTQLDRIYGKKAFTYD